MFLFLLFISCLLYGGFYWWRKQKPAFLPSYPGALPLIGHAYLFFGDNTHVWETYKKISLECLRKGGALNISMGPIAYQVLTDPEDSFLVMNSSLDKHYIFSFAKEWLGQGLLTASAPVWNSHRKVLYPMFSQQVLNGFLDLFNRQAKRFVNQIAAKVGKGPFDHERYLLLVGLETICQTALGLDIDDQITGNKEYMHAIEGVMEGFVKRFPKVWLHSDFIFNWSSLKKEQDGHLKLIHNMSKKFQSSGYIVGLPYRKSRVQTQSTHLTLQSYTYYKLIIKIFNGEGKHRPETCIPVLQKRQELFKKKSNLDVDNKLEEFKPFIDQILEIPKDKAQFTDKEIREEINTLIITGYDMAALLLTYALMLLGSYQDVQDRAYKELKEVFEDSDRDVEKQDLSKLIYIEAILKETLRLFPVTPILARHNTTDIKLKCCTLPAGSNCFVSIYGLHRHPMWGADVEQFKPERWLDPSSLPDNPNVFAGFGMGRRACIGRVYAMMSMKTTLAHTLRRYHVTSDVTKLVFKMDALLKPASGQHIIVKPRK